MNMTLEQRIAALEATLMGEQGAPAVDSVPADQVRELVEAVRTMFGKKEASNSALFTEIGELAKFINNAKKELEEVQKSQIADKEIPHASNQLDAIIQMTEAATGRIMDECDRLNMFHSDMREQLLNMDPPLDPNAMAGIDDALTQAMTSITHINEACGFQDITGQRIQKVVRALQEIERQVLRMVVVFGLMENEATLDAETKAELQEDANLLNGPQLEGQGLEQDDIDAILAKLL